MDGVILIDKPVGPSSFDAVRIVKRVFQTGKVGHAGTLDPMASGLLIVCIGRFTRLVPFLMESSKVYSAEVQLGQETNTDDAEGEVIATKKIPTLSKSVVEAVLARFTGVIEQIPPMYSALKKNGVPLYKLARKGEVLELPARRVVIDRIDLLELSHDRFRIEVHCQKGTYIRALARDVGRALGTVAHLSSLRRLKTSGFSVEDAIGLDRLALAKSPVEIEKFILSGGQALCGLPRLNLREDDEVLVRNGVSLNMADYPASSADMPYLCLLDSAGELRAIAEPFGALLKMVRVFH